MVTTGLVFIAGEITTEEYLDIPKIARGVIQRHRLRRSPPGIRIRDIGGHHFDRSSVRRYRYGCRYRRSGGPGYDVRFRLHPDRCPDADAYPHGSPPRQEDVRGAKRGGIDWIKPDGKSQVTIEYIDNVPHKINTVLLSTQHSEEISLDEIKAGLTELVIEPVVSGFDIDSSDYRILVNPTGKFVMGGPQGDTGLTGRKIIVDTYGGFGSHGGGAFSGKDPTKVDRSASYAARHVAKNIVGAGFARECEVQLAYAIGVAEPVSVMVDTFGTGKISDEELTKIVRELFDLTPKGIIERLDLRRPIYRKTAAFGHFGREEDTFTWERLDYVDKLEAKA